MNKRKVIKISSARAMELFGKQPIYMYKTIYNRVNSRDVIFQFIGKYSQSPKGWKLCVVEDGESDS